MAKFKSIEELKSQIRTNPESIIEETQKVICNLMSLGNDLNAVAYVNQHDVLRQAEQMAQQSDRSAPLFGIPLAHKNLYQRKDWICDGGSKTLATHRPNKTAFSLEQLDYAGALDCGRLTCVELGLGTTGHNEYAGTSKNPWNPNYICGGSSSGSGAAVAAGIVAASLGTDTGGSVRLPAAACGLVSIKPTHGLIDRSGVIALSPTLDTVGPMTRSVRDAGIILQVLAGKIGEDSLAIPINAPDYLAEIENGLNGFRIGWPTNFFMEHTDDCIVQEIQNIFQLTSKLGAVCTDVAVPGIETANALNMLITAVEGASLHEAAIIEKHKDFGPQSLSRLLVGSFVQARDYQNALAYRGKLAQSILHDTFSQVDAVMTPIWPYLLPTIEDSDMGAKPGAADMVFRSGHNTRPVNYLGFPAVTLPIGLDRNGLPLSVQLIGAPFTESKLLKIARSLERELCFWSSHTPNLRVDEA